MAVKGCHGPCRDSEEVDLRPSPFRREGGPSIRKRDSAERVQSVSPILHEARLTDTRVGPLRVEVAAANDGRIPVGASVLAQLQGTPEGRDSLTLPTWREIGSEETQVLLSNADCGENNKPRRRNFPNLYYRLD